MNHPQDRQQTECPTPSYIGSVRFFKHLILLTLALLILIPTATSIVFGIHNMALRDELLQLVEVQQEKLEVRGNQEIPAEPEQAPIDPKQDLVELKWDLAETPLYQELYPELYAVPTERASVIKEKVCYLTFDDGPSARTPEILEILERHDVKATFFVVGKTDEQSAQWMRDIVAAGHTIGMHSASHSYRDVYASAESFLEDYARIYHIIEDATGIAPQISRFPGGSINAYNGHCYNDLIAEVTRRGFVYFDWNVTNGDAAQSHSIPVATLIENALGNVDSLRRAIVLMHDSADKVTTVEALPAIIEGYRNAGFTFEALTPEVKPIVYGYPN